MVAVRSAGYGRVNSDEEARPMKRSPKTYLALASATLAVAAAGASAATMHPELGAHLAGMGEHGVVNLQLTASSGKICWTFDVPSSTAATSAAIRVGANGATLLELGMHYTKSGCETESKMTLEHLEANPATYSVWVNTKAHPGDLRGALFAGMAHM
jgi:hypothetical protein